MATFLVTGATGSIGSQVVKQLDAKGEKVRALVRDVKKGEKLKGKNVELVQGDLEKPDTLTNAFKGVDGVFVVVNASDKLVDQEKNAFNAAKAAGVKHVVLLSTAGADPNGQITLAQWHGKSQENLKSSGLSHTVLQPTFFMQNLLGNVDSVKGQGKIFGAMKEGRVPMIDVADIAASGVAVLTSGDFKKHNGQTYYLTGPDPISMKTASEKIGKAIGKTVEYVDLPLDTFVGNLKGFGMPAWLADDYGKMFGWFATDSAWQPVDTVEKLTGRKPRTLDAFVADVAGAFK
jgi:uncharacterized protein YbjT (DUF2867 family)